MYSKVVVSLSEIESWKSKQSHLNIIKHIFLFGLNFICYLKCSFKYLL